MNHRSIRRAYLLAEVVAAIPLIVVVSTLLSVGIATIMRVQRNSVDVAAGYGTINSLVDTLREDTRAALSAGYVPAAEGMSTIELRTANGSVCYDFAGHAVIRRADGDADRVNVPKKWHIEQAVITAQLDGPATATALTGEPSDGAQASASLLTVHIRWRGQSKHMVDPTRRFEATFAVGRGYQR